MKSLRSLSICALLMVALGGCKFGSAKIAVICRGAPDNVDCEATHTEGTAKANACWKVRIACSGGVTAEASACQLVEPKQSVHHLIGYKEFSNYDTCKDPSGLKVEDLKIEVK